MSCHFKEANSGVGHCYIILFQLLQLCFTIFVRRAEITFMITNVDDRPATLMCSASLLLQPTFSVLCSRFKVRHPSTCHAEMHFFRSDVWEGRQDNSWHLFSFIRKTCKPCSAFKLVQCAMGFSRSDSCNEQHECFRKCWQSKVCDNESKHWGLFPWLWLCGFYAI